MTDQGLPQMLTSTEVARMLRVSAMTLNRWTLSGHMPAHRTPGGHWRYRPEDVEALTKLEFGIELMTTAEVAALFGASTRTIRRWAHEGHLRVELLAGTKHRYRRSQVMALARECGMEAS